MNKNKDDEVKKILLKMFQDTKANWKKNIAVLPDKVLEKAVSRLKKIYKVKIDEGEIGNVIRKRLKADNAIWSFSIDKLAHAIAEKVEEWMR